MVIYIDDNFTVHARVSHLITKTDKELHQVIYPVITRAPFEDFKDSELELEMDAVCSICIPYGEAPPKGWVRDWEEKIEKLVEQYYVEYKQDLLAFDMFVDLIKLGAL